MAWASCCWLTPLASRSFRRFRTMGLPPLNMQGLFWTGLYVAAAADTALAVHRQSPGLPVDGDGPHGAGFGAEAAEHAEGFVTDHGAAALDEVPDQAEV